MTDITKCTEEGDAPVPKLTTEELAAEAEKAQQAVGRLRLELAKIEHEQYGWVDHQMRAARDKIMDEANARWGDGIARLKERTEEAKAEANRLQERLGYARESLIGQRRVRWLKGWGYQFQKTGEVGIVSIWGVKSEYPSNMFHSLPMIGTTYIRILKADGTPSKKFSWDLLGWYPEGADPNEEK